MKFCVCVVKRHAVIVVVFVAAAVVIATCVKVHSTGCSACARNVAGTVYVSRSDRGREFLH